MPPWEQLLVLPLAAASLLALLLLVNRSQIDHRWKLLLSMLVTFEGLSIALLAHKLPWYFGMVLALVAGGQLVQLLRTRPDALPATHTMASRFLDRVTGAGALTPWFPFIGLALAVVDLAANRWLFNARLGSNDWVVLTAAATWVAYNYIPSDYARERDFGFVFLNALVLILVVPIVAYNLATGSAGADSATLGETRAVSLLLTQPLANLLDLLGYEARANGGILEYELVGGGWAKVSIAQGCSGIYSTAIFVAAFMGFVATEYQRLDRTVGLLLALGILTAYVANLFRMAIIVIAGHYWGGGALAWTHANAGWLIFLLWVGLFWSLLFRYLVELPPEIQSRRASGQAAVAGDTAPRDAAARAQEVPDATAQRPAVQRAVAGMTATRAAGRGRQAAPAAGRKAPSSEGRKPAPIPRRTVPASAAVDTRRAKAAAGARVKVPPKDVPAGRTRAKVPPKDIPAGRAKAKPRPKRGTPARAKPRAKRAASPGREARPEAAEAAKADAARSGGLAAVAGALAGATAAAAANLVRRDRGRQ